MSYRRLSKKPLLFRSFTGLTVSEFNFVCKDIEYNYDDGIAGICKRNNHYKTATALQISRPTGDRAA
jgi:hypothetical protein